MRKLVNADAALAVKPLRRIVPQSFAEAPPTTTVYEMGVLEYFLYNLNRVPYDPKCPDDMTRHYAPVRGEFYGPHDGIVSVSWYNAEGTLLREISGQVTQLFDADAFWDAIEHMELLRLQKATRNGGTVSIKGADAGHLHDVIVTVRDLVDFFAREAARPVR